MSKFLKLLLRIFLGLFILVNIITAFHAYKFTHFYSADEVSIKIPDKKTAKPDVAEKLKEYFKQHKATKAEKDLVLNAFKFVGLIK